METLKENYLPFLFESRKLASGKIENYYNFNLPKNLLNDYYDFTKLLQSEPSYKIISKAKNLGVDFKTEGYKTHCTIKYNGFEFKVSNFEHSIKSAIIAMFFCNIL